MKPVLNSLKGGAAVALFLFAVSFVSVFSFSSVYAQCPDDTYGISPSVSTYPWTSASYTITIPGTTCQIEIDYCWRDVPGATRQVWVYQIIPLSSDCDPISPTDLINWGQQLVFNDPTINGDVPCSKNLYRVVSVFRPICWNLGGTSITGRPEFVQCFGSPNWCKITCSVCVDIDLTVHKSNCTGTSYTSESCGTTPPPSWEQGVCYTVGCIEP